MPLTMIKVIKNAYDKGYRDCGWGETTLKTKKKAEVQALEADQTSGKSCGSRRLREENKQELEKRTKIEGEMEQDAPSGQNRCAHVCYIPIFALKF